MYFMTFLSFNLALLSTPVSKKPHLHITVIYHYLIFNILTLWIAVQHLLIYEATLNPYN
jgi:hypothetical protein